MSLFIFGFSLSTSSHRLQSRFPALPCVNDWSTECTKKFTFGFRLPALPWIKSQPVKTFAQHSCTWRDYCLSTSTIWKLKWSTNCAKTCTIQKCAKIVHFWLSLRRPTLCTTFLHMTWLLSVNVLQIDISSCQDHTLSNSSNHTSHRCWYDYSGKNWKNRTNVQKTVPLKNVQKLSHSRMCKKLPHSKMCKKLYHKKMQQIVPFKNVQKQFRDKNILSQLSLCRAKLYVVTTALFSVGKYCFSTIRAFS